MSDVKCQDCSGTGKMLTESITLSRPYYEKESRGVVYDVINHGDWAETQCHCVGEDE